MVGLMSYELNQIVFEKNLTGSLLGGFYDYSFRYEG